MPHLELADILARAYSSMTRHRPPLSTVITEFTAAKSDPVFVATARAKLAALDKFSAHLEARGVTLANRDFAQHVQREFLTEVLAGDAA